MQLSLELNASLNALILEVGADIAADVRAKVIKAITDAVAAEREECAKIAEAEAWAAYDNSKAPDAVKIYEAIRART